MANPNWLVAYRKGSLPVAGWILWVAHSGSSRNWALRIEGFAWPRDQLTKGVRSQASGKHQDQNPSPWSGAHLPAPLQLQQSLKSGPHTGDDDDGGLMHQPCPILGLLTFQAQKHLCCLFFLQGSPYFSGQITQAIKLISKARKGNNI